MEEATSTNEHGTPSGARAPARGRATGQVVPEQRREPREPAWYGPVRGRPARAPAPVRALRRRPALLLALVAVAYLAVSLLVLPPSLPLGWDEVVYVTQVSDQAPPAYLSPPRARGLIALIAPVAAQTASIEVLRWYMAVCSAAALFGSYALWLRVRRTFVVPLAALLFAGLWTTIFYGPAVMPNLWVAFGAVAATALTVLVIREPSRPAYLLGLGAVLAASALVRPSDAVMLAAALGLAVLWRLRWRPRATLLPALSIGLGIAAGLAQWVAEAYLAYGGLLERLEGSAERNGGSLGPHVFGDLRSVNGPLGCGQNCHSGISVVEAGLWLGLLAGAVLAAVLARRTREFNLTVMPIAAAAAIAGLYFFYIPNSAPRFLLPVYALLALPCAYTVRHLPRVTPAPARGAVGVLLGAGVLTYLVGQQVVLAHMADRVEEDRFWLASVAGDLRELGVEPPCMVSGESAVGVSYPAGCRSRHPAVPDTEGTPGFIQRAVHGGERVAVLTRGGEPPPEAYVHGWVEHVITSPNGRHRMHIYTPHRQAD